MHDPLQDGIYGYRTLAEALRSLPGIYIYQDRMYAYVGVRGFGRPWDYNGRVLLLVDGERMNEAVWDSSYLGNEGLVDIDLIDRIEFIPGPGSAVYGNNAFFGVIQVFTKRGRQLQGAEVSGEYGRFDTYKGRASYGRRFENGTDLLLSFTEFDRQGPDRLYFPEYDAPATNHGRAERLDHDRYQSGFGKLAHRPWLLEAGFNRRIKGNPLAYDDSTLFNDPGLRVEDNSGFATLRFDDRITEHGGLYARFGAHLYDSEWRFPYRDPELPTRFVNVNRLNGVWWDGELRYTNTAWDRHKWMIGGEIQDNLRQMLKNRDIGYDWVIRDEFQTTRYGVYVQDEYQPWDPITLVAGARYDYNPLGGASANPRVGLIWRALDTTTLKLLYGSAFRSPSAAEMAYALPGVATRPETVRSLELVAEHLFSPRTRLNASVYHNRISQLIDTVPGPDGTGWYANRGRADSVGLELEGEHRFEFGLRTRISYTYQQVEDQDGLKPTNSPLQLLKLNASAPLGNSGWRAGFETQYMSSRTTLAGRRTGQQILSNLHVSGEPWEHVQLSFGLYNLFNQKFAEPLGPDARPDTAPMDGLTFRLKATLSY